MPLIGIPPPNRALSPLTQNSSTRYAINRRSPTRQLKLQPALRRVASRENLIDFGVAFIQHRSQLFLPNYLHSTLFEENMESACLQYFDLSLPKAVA